MSFTQIRPPLPASSSGLALVNPSLYSRLALACKRGVLNGSVKIHDAGRPASGRYVRDPSNLDRQKLVLDDRGETYSVCCPGCNDSRNRLYINHLWGIWDSTTKSCNKWLIHCFNEDCPRRIDNFSDDLLEKLEYSSLTVARPPVLMASGPSSDVGRPELGAPIGLTKKLSQLPPTHPANVFVLAKGLDPLLLSDNFDVSYCVSSNVRAAVDRLVVPIDFKGVRVGWQARYLGGKGDTRCNNPLCRSVYIDLPEDSACPSCKTGVLTRPVKWLTSAGLKVGSVLFNYDHALSFPYVVVTEGPMDVIAMGHPELGPGHRGPVVCTFGHKIGQHQLALLAPWQSAGTVYVMYDGDVANHTIDQIEKLAQYFPGKLVYVPLPKDKDPADLLSGAWPLVLAAGVRAGAKELPVGRYVHA